MHYIFVLAEEALHAFNPKQWVVFLYKGELIKNQI